MAIEKYLTNPTSPLADLDKERERTREKKSVIQDGPEVKVLRANQQRETIITHFGNPEDRQKAEEKENKKEIDCLLEKNSTLEFTEKELSEEPGEKPEEETKEEAEINAVVKEGLEKVFSKISTLKRSKAVPWEDSSEEK